MKILIIGLPLFAERLKNDLRLFAPEHSFSSFNTYYSKWEQLKFLFALPHADLVISLNGASSKSGALDRVIKKKKNILMHWQGTDVLLATQAFKKNTLNRKYIDYASHYTHAPWLQEELKHLGIGCNLLDFKWVTPIHDEHTFQNISVHTYLPKGKEDTYGYKSILRLAEKHNDIDFYVAGSDGKRFPSKNNIHFLGWVSEKEMDNLRHLHPIHIRVIAHDGYAQSVMQALACGNEVIWTMPHQQCIYLASNGNIETAFSHCINKLKERNLAANKDNIEYAKKHLSREKILGTFIQTIEQLVNE